MPEPRALQPHDLRPQAAFLGSTSLNRVLAEMRLTSLDIGARGGMSRDLLVLAPSVDAIGFEPDPVECERLNSSARTVNHPWHSLTFVPVALGEAAPARKLHLYSRLGCSSLYSADVGLAAEFGRSDYFQHSEDIELATTPLDVAAERYAFTDASHIKIDIQGAELEVLRSGERLVQENVLAIRTEIEFIPLYHGQAVFGEVMTYLTGLGFVAMQFMELHHWRRMARVKHPRVAPGLLPYSRGQMVHGDVLFFRDPRTMQAGTEIEIQKLLKAAFLALSYEFVDHAFAILTRPEVEAYLRSRYGIDPAVACGEVSTYLLRQRGLSGLYERARASVDAVRSNLRQRRARLKSGRK